MAESHQEIRGAAADGVGDAALEPVAQTAVASTDALANARTGYQVAANLYMQENQITWARFNVMLTANSIILASTGVAAGGSNRLLVLALVLPVVGLRLCKIWWGMMERGFAYHDVWRHAAYDLETKFFAAHVRTLAAGEELRPSGESAGVATDPHAHATTKESTPRAFTYAGQVIHLFRWLYWIAIIQIVISFAIATCQVYDIPACSKAKALLRITAAAHVNE